MSKAFAIIGCTGSGKTYFTKQLIANVNKSALLIFDTNKEYEDYYPYPFDGDMDKFLEKARKVSNAVILIEDATSFFSTQGRSDELVKLMIAKRHSNNTYILLFHAFGDLPKYIYRKCTHVVIFKTLDSERHLKAIDNDALTAEWQRIQNECAGHEFFSTYPPPKGIAPPSAIFSIY